MLETYVVRRFKPGDQKSATRIRQMELKAKRSAATHKITLMNQVIMAEIPDVRNDGLSRSIRLTLACLAAFNGHPLRMARQRR